MISAEGNISLVPSLSRRESPPKSGAGWSEKSPLNHKTH